MADQVAAALVEVDKFLERKGRDYETFLDDVLRELTSYRDRRKNSSTIYRIYSRADKQLGGAKLKSRHGIATKLLKWREKNPTCKIGDIHDIIGATIVVYFENEMASLAEGICRTSSLVFEVEKQETVERDNYNAEHLVVRKRSSARVYSAPLCEIQIKSLLHDGWATRTHDLIYKSSRPLDRRIKDQVTSLTKLVEALEEQSVILRSYILEEDEDDDIRRDAAVSHLFFEMTQKYGNVIDGQVGEISKTLMAERDYFSRCSDNDPLLSELMQRWKTIHAECGECKSLCRFMTLFALVREARDFDSQALDAIEGWIDKAGADVEMASALSFKAVSLWALGELGESIEVARRVVAFAEDKGLPSQVLKANLAYYLAEQLFRTRQATPANAIPEITEFLEACEEIEDERHRMSVLDTQGSVRIMTATTRDQVWEGRGLCAEAKKWAQSHPDQQAVFDLFYELHERRAQRLLSELS
jgi:ppGpp synthetase/RelA/SpoT-type nucleotidyltranferase